jgi:hypothetical protein
MAAEASLVSVAKRKIHVKVGICRLFSLFFS